MSCFLSHSPNRFSSLCNSFTIVLQHSILHPGLSILVLHRLHQDRRFHSSVHRQSFADCKCFAASEQTHFKFRWQSILNSKDPLDKLQLTNQHCRCLLIGFNADFSLSLPHPSLHLTPKKTPLITSQLSGMTALAVDLEAPARPGRGGWKNQCGCIRSRLHICYN